jgi:hypothetical protein
MSLKGCHPRLSISLERSLTVYITMSYPSEQVDEAAKKSDDRDLVQSPSLGPTETANTVTYDAVFGTITEDGPNYRNVSIVFGLSIHFPQVRLIVLIIGGMDWHISVDDEDPNWSRGLIHSSCL